MRFTRRVLILATLSLAAACGDSSDSPAASDDASSGGNRLLADRAGIYHLSDRIDATSLELNSNGSFRWKTSGCDFGFDGAGHWSAEDDTLVLVPDDGKENFNWPGKLALARATRVTLRWDAGNEEFEAEAESNQGTYKLSWQPGGMCARCEAPPGEWSSACDDPF